MNNTGFVPDRNLFSSFGYALKGLALFFLTQFNAWIHLGATGVVVGAGFLFRISDTEWCLIALAAGMVFVAEMLNTAVEFLTDLVSPDYNNTAGKVKDLAAGAVLVAALTAMVIGAIVFVPKVI